MGEDRNPCKRRWKKQENRKEERARWWTHACRIEEEEISIYLGRQKAEGLKIHGTAQAL